MKRLLTAAVLALAGLVGLRVVRRLARRQPLMERAMARVAPKMMDACFGRMAPEQRQFMLAHCRGMLDRVEAKYGSGELQPATAGEHGAW